MKLLGNFMKKLPQLQKLNLNLLSNDIGKNYDNIKYLGEGLKQLINLKNLQLDFSCNLLGDKAEFMK